MHTDQILLGDLSEDGILRLTLNDVKRRNALVALSRNVSNKHAMEMLLTGDMTPATRAAEIGLVNRVVSEASLRQATSEMALKIASKSSMTLATGKRAFYAQREMPLPLMITTQWQNWRWRDFQAGPLPADF